MPRVILIEGTYLTPEDLSLMAKGIPPDEFGWNAETVLDEILETRAQFWRMQDGASGMIITKIEEHPAGRFAYVWYIYGKGFINNIDEIFESLRWYLKNIDCVGVYGQVIRPGLEKVYSQLGFFKTGSNYFKGI